MTEDLAQRALALKAEHPDWGYIRIGAVLGWHKDKVRRAIEHAERKRRLLPAVVAEIEPRTAAEFAARIKAAWNKSVESILEVGRLLAVAKGTLEHGQFHDMLTRELPFGARTAQRLMAISSDERITNATHVSHLPPSWGTLYELTKLDDEVFDQRIADGTINPDMERRDIATEVKRTQRASRERILGGIQCALPTQKFGVIYADPEWSFEPWSRETGMDRSAENHYPCSVFERIQERDVQSIAADDCVLFLWATVPMLPQAIMVMGAWGFDYKSHLIWVKDKIGTGYWFRNQHELLLVGTRGKVPAPAMGEQWSSVLEAPVLAHSQKPDSLLDLIEQYFPTLPKIELNRRGPPRKSWSAWGFEAEPPHDPETGEVAA